MRDSPWTGGPGPDESDDRRSLWGQVPMRRSGADDLWTGPTGKVFRREMADRVTGQLPARTDGSVTRGAPSWTNNEAALDDQLPPLADLRLLIVDDCTLQRENLAAAIAAHCPARPKAAWDLSSLVTALNNGSPNLVLINLDTRDSAMLVQATFEVRPDIRVIVLGMSEDDEARIVACAEAGVSGYHLRNESIDDLIALIGRVASGESLCSPRVSAMLLRRLSALAADRQPSAKELVLTSREAQILRMLEMGLSNRDIAERLCIAVHTVKNHVHSVLTKLGVNTRAEAAAQFRTMRFNGIRPPAYDSAIEGNRS